MNQIPGPVHPLEEVHQRGPAAKYREVRHPVAGEHEQLLLAVLGLTEWGGVEHGIIGGFLGLRILSE